MLIPHYRCGSRKSKRLLSQGQKTQAFIKQSYFYSHYYLGVLKSLCNKMSTIIWKLSAKNNLILLQEDLGTEKKEEIIGLKALFNLIGCLLLASLSSKVFNFPCHFADLKKKKTKTKLYSSDINWPPIFLSRDEVSKYIFTTDV